MEQNGVKVNMKPEYKLILGAARYRAGAYKAIPLEEYLFINKEILESIDLFFLEPKKTLEQFKDKILFVYSAKYLSTNQIEPVNSFIGIKNEIENAFNFEDFLRTSHLHAYKADEVIDYFSSKENLFLKIKVTE